MSEISQRILLSQDHGSQTLNFCYPRGSIVQSKSTRFQILLGILEWRNKWLHQAEEPWAWFQLCC